jgi:hypothetical protein
MKKIGDRQLESLFYDNCVISGGCISSIFHDEAVQDIDLYPKTDSALTLIKTYIITQDKNIKLVDSYEIEDPSNPQPKQQFKLATMNAVTLTNDVQFIYMDTWDYCKNKFDFVHCMPHYDLATQKLYISESQFNSIKEKLLIPTGKVDIKDRRLEKYQKRGWGGLPIKATGFVWNDAGLPGFTAQEITKAVI